MLTADKQAIIKKYRLNSKDVGSTQVQVALMTERISQITAHLKMAPKDKMGRRGLLQLVGQRRRLLNYLANRNPQAYQKLIKSLKLRK